MKNEFKLLRESAYDWDERPHDYFNFTGRVVHKYGLPYIRSKLHFKYNYVVDKNESDANIIGKFVDQVKDEMLMNNAAGANQVQHNAEEKQLLHVVDMEVPASQYDTWINSVPSKYFDEYKQKKHILDQYLSKFNSYERNKVIKIMCENSDSKNYVHFLDKNPDTMTTQQYLIYKDVIRFYEEIYLKEISEQDKLWSKLSERESELAKINEPNAAIVSLSDDEEGNMDQLRDILSNKEVTSDENIDALKKQLDDMIASTENMSNMVEEPIAAQAPVEERRNVRTLDIKPAKTLLFTPQTTVINAAAPFGASKAYEPNYKQTMAQKGISLSNNKIATVGYVNNISDLIDERNAKAAANQALVNEIIQNQIAYNNQFGANIQSSLKTSSTIYSSPIQQSKPNSMGINTRSSIMSQNFNAQGSVQTEAPARQNPMGMGMSMGMSNRQAATSDAPAMAKPLLIKKANVAKPAQSYQTVSASQSVQTANMINRSPINTTAQSTLTKTVSATQTTQANITRTVSINLNQTNHTQTSVSAEPNTTVKSTLIKSQQASVQSSVEQTSTQVSKPISIKPLSERSTNQDIVGVYKINTKDIAEEQEQKKVLVGIPTKKL